MKSKLLASALFYAGLFLGSNSFAQTAPTASFSMASPTVCAESTVQITDFSTNFPTSWSYSVNGVVYSTAQNPDVIITTPGTYTIDLEATNSNGTSPVFSQTLLVEPLPVVTVSGNTLVCTLSSSTLSATGADTYSWSSGSVVSTEVINPAASSIYTLVGTSTLTGCSDSVFVSVTTVALPTLSVSDATICSGATYTLAPSGASTYSYSGGSSTITPLTSTNYTVSGTDAVTGCSDSVVVAITVNVVSITVNSGNTCSGQAFTIVASGANTYTYSGGTNVVSPTIPTTYTVSGTDANGCTDSTTVLVGIAPSPTITLNSGNICAGQSFTINAGGATTYTYPGGSNVITPLTNTTYVVTGWDQTTGCIGTAVLALTVNAIPTVAVNSGTICQGESFVLVPSGAATYTISGGMTVVSPTVTNTYSVTGTSANGCLSGAAAIATVIVSGTAPTITISSSSPGIACKGSTIILTANGVVNYTWSTGQTTQSVAISPTVTATYTMQGTDANGCSAIGSIMQFVTECTGIEKNASNIQFNLFPNPTSGDLTLEVASEMSVIISNSLGQVVLKQELTPGTNSINMNGQNSGIYFVTVKQNAEVKTIRIIKN